MALIPIVKYGDPILRKKTEPVENIPEIQDLLDDMFETMYEEGGIGLAANQVGLDMHCAVIDITHAEEDEAPRVFINMEVLESNDASDMEEGCLSIPDIRATVIRPEKVLLRYQDEAGEVHEEQFEGLLCRVIQHELDHLNGVIFTDRLTPAKRSMINKRLAKIAETGVPSTGTVH